MCACTCLVKDVGKFINKRVYVYVYVYIYLYMYIHVPRIDR